MSDPRYDVAYVYREPATNGDPRRTGWGGPGFYLMDAGYPYHMSGPFETEAAAMDGVPLDFFIYPTTAENARIDKWEREQDAIAEANQ